MIVGLGASLPPSRRSDAARLLVPVTVGAAVAVTLGVYGRLHTPTGIDVRVPGFSGPVTVKVWLGTAAALFAVLQLVFAALMYGKMPAMPALAWAGPAHRWSGRIAFLLSVPVAVHCLYVLGFQAIDARVGVHSLAGCLFYGAFTTKMLVLTRPGPANWVLSLIGGLVFAAMIGLWITSALWYFASFGVKT